MYKRILKTFAAAVMITAITGTTVFADDVNTLKNSKNQAQNELDQLEDQLAYLLTEMDKLELDMANKSAEIDQATSDLAVAEVVQKQQYDDMKLRIKYMYEDQSASISDVFFTSANMGEVLNKAEYMQQVYDYDRSKLQEMADTASSIAELKAKLESDKAQLEKDEEELTNKQALLYTTIEEKKNEISDWETKINDAVKKAALATATKSYTSYQIPTQANNNSSVASGIVSLAYSFIGTPYVSGGSSPRGFDCSGFTSYLFAQYGIGLSRSSSAQIYGGSPVGSLSEALPGDIICYPGHVGLYVGGGMMIHASVPGDYVKLSSVNIGMSIIGIRRYW
ncbi:MAG: NlpC/P60 family protein [Eubacteriales bacterium]|nr:NlpC/P60 family protein [Eubacteriales bacterium]